METHREMIARIGIRSLARKLGHANHTTVQGWHDRNEIPLKHWPDVVQATADDAKPVTATDLVPPDLRDAAA